MQAYHDPYYAQPQFGQQPYYQQYPSYPVGYGHPPQHAAPFPVYPTNYDAAQVTPAPMRPRPLDRAPSRASTPGKPLKSAMKKNAGGMPPAGVPLSRGRTSSNGRQRTYSATRTRSNSVPRFVPDHLMLTLRSTNELLLENVAYQSMTDELAEEILPIWPHGVNTTERQRQKWRVEFAGNPWASGGLLENMLAGRMICRLFAVLARQGHSYLATVNAGHPWKPPSLIFIDSPPDPDVLIFLIMFSRSGDRLTILDGPPDLTQQLGMELRATFPRKITTDRATEDGLHVYEIRKAYGAPEVDKSVLIACVLRFFNAAGFKLNGAVPMGSKGIFRFGGRREFWIFRSTPWQSSKDTSRRPSSRSSRREMPA